MNDDDVVSLEEMSTWRAPLMPHQLDMIEDWLDADWESHDETTQEVRNLIYALIGTARDRG